VRRPPGGAPHLAAEKVLAAHLAAERVARRGAAAAPVAPALPQPASQQLSEKSLNAATIRLLKKYSTWNLKILIQFCFF